MTIIVETGAIVADANSYVSEAEVDAYHDLRANTAWTEDAEDEAKEAAIILANQAIEDMYRDRWIGYKTNNNDAVQPQLLAWPRRASKESGNTDPLEDPDGIEVGINTIPQQLKNCICEAALIQLSTNLNTKVLNHNEQRLKRDKVGPLEQEFFDTSPTLASYPIIERMLTGLAAPATGGITANLLLTAEERDNINNPPQGRQWWLNEKYFNVNI